MHTPYGFTGQREDSSAAVGPGASGLDYFHARYYDPVVGRFTSLDTKLGGDPFGDSYGYVGRNPEAKIDPTGQDEIDPQELNQLIQLIIFVTALLGNYVGAQRNLGPEPPRLPVPSEMNAPS